MSDDLSVQVLGTYGSPERPRRLKVKTPIRSGPDSLAHAVSELVRERVGEQQQLAWLMRVSPKAISAIFCGVVHLTPLQLNRILDHCRATDEERSALNAWGAREKGWRI